MAKLDDHEHPSEDGARWLLLIHQLPAKPPYLRVKVWRRLQGLGAILVKNSVYALPANEQTLEDFQWLLREIEQGGGEGMVCEASLVDGLGDREVRALFDAARDADYAEVAKEARGLTADLGQSDATGPAADAKTRLVRLRRRYAEVSAIDFFGATGRITVEALLSELEGRLAEPTELEVGMAPSTSTEVVSLLGKTWVTRQGVYVDRIACAWLVRRFIDPEARFKFIAAKDYEPAPGELRFDMFKGEFTHVGDRCSFEVLLDRIGLDDPALEAIAEIIHDIDLKDAKFGREQTVGIAHVLDGVCVSHQDDLARIERGSDLLNDTYEQFRKGGSRGRPA